VSDNWGDLPDPNFDALGAVGVLDYIRDTTRAQSRLEARRLAALEWYARAREGSGGIPASGGVAGGGEWIADHLAADTTVSIARAGRDLSLAYALTHRLPNTLSALRSGVLDRARVDTIDYATSVLADEHARIVDTRLFPRALELNPGQLARFVRKLVAEVDPEGAAKRAEIQREQRRVSLEHDPDGMSWLNMYLTSEDAVACWDRITRLARDTHDPDRSMNQKRADAVRDLLLGTGDTHTTTHVYVTVDAKTLLGLAEHSGELRGYGPLPADRVRELAYRLNAEWSGVLVDENRHATALSERKYRFRGRLAELIRLRDRTCGFPSCNRTAENTDIDHSIPFQRGGPTSQTNGHCLCRRHHRAKQSRHWTVTRGAGGESRWTSDLGTSHTSTPEPLASPAPF
jgi:hypothetical protein